MPRICGQVHHCSISHSTSERQQLTKAFVTDLKRLTGISPILCSNTNQPLICKWPDAARRLGMATILHRKVHALARSKPSSSGWHQFRRRASFVCRQ